MNQSNLCGDGGVADVAAGGGGGVGAEELMMGWPAGVSMTRYGIPTLAPPSLARRDDGARGVVVFGVGGEFAGVEGGDDEGFYRRWSLLAGVVEEVLEHVARAAPGGAKGGQGRF